MAGLLGQGAMATRETLLPSWLEISVNVSRSPARVGLAGRKHKSSSPKLLLGRTTLGKLEKLDVTAAVFPPHSYTKTQTIHVIDP